MNPRGCETAAYNQQNIHSFNKCGDTTYLITRDDMQVEINVRCHIFYPFNWIEGIMKLLKNMIQYIFIIFFTTFCLKILKCYWFEPLRSICVTKDHVCFLLVANTIRSFPHSWLVTGFVTRVTERVPHVEAELLTLP